MAIQLRSLLSKKKYRSGRSEKTGRRGQLHLESLEQRCLLASVAQAFQDGKYPSISYSGTRDTKIRSGYASTNYGTAPYMAADGNPDGAALLKWDLSQLSPNGTVQSVTLTFNVANTSADVYEIYAMNRNWVESQATWSAFSTGNSWGIAGAKASTDKGSAVLGTLSATTTGSKTVTLNAAGVSLVQSWINSPATNFGIIIQDYANPNDLEVASREATTIANRPKITVTYLSGGNQAPVVSAGPDQTLLLPELSSLHGNVSDDLYPNSVVAATWTKVSGPGTVTFGNASSPITSVRYGSAGTYVLRLTGYDGALTTTDDVTVTVNALPPVTKTVRITGVHHEQYRVTPGDGAVVDMTGATFYGTEDARWLEGSPPPSSWPTHSQIKNMSEVSNDEKNPVSLDGNSKRVVMKGGTVIGKMNHLAPWHIWKYNADGTGMHLEGSDWYEVDGFRMDNVSDGFDPRGTATAKFRIHDVYVSRVHDDAIENDDVHTGEIRDSFIQTHTFYSARGSVSNPNAMFRVDNTVVELILQPFQGGTGGTNDRNSSGGYPYPDGLGTGSIFKMDWDYPDRSGKVFVSNSVFLVPRNASSSNRAMSFAEGYYENVTVVWLGGGPYPAAVPPGVTITTDRTVFDQAKARFFAAHPQFTPLSGSSFAAPAPLAATAAATDQAILSLAAGSAVGASALSTPTVTKPTVASTLVPTVTVATAGKTNIADPPSSAKLTAAPPKSAPPLGTKAAGSKASVAQDPILPPVTLRDLIKR